MDDRLFGFTRRPFPACTAPDLYFPSDSHETALALLRSAFQSGDGIALLDGSPGTGKTITLLKLLEILGHSVVPVFIPSTRFSRAIELYQAILFDLGLTYLGMSEGEVRLAVTDRMLSTLSNHKRVALVLDEAHHLQPELLEEIRLLDNLEAGGQKASFTILSGLPALRVMLESVSLQGLSQRIRCRSRIEPLTQEESGRYLLHQLEQAGHPQAELYTKEAIELIAAHGLGTPRILNQIAWTAFEFARDGEQEFVDAEAAYEALTRLGLSIESTDDDSPQLAQPSISIGAARSIAGEAREHRQAGEPGKAESPKQTARKRRTA